MITEIKVSKLLTVTKALMMQVAKVAIAALQHNKLIVLLAIAIA